MSAQKRGCSFMDSDVYLADAPWSIPTLLTINVLALYTARMRLF